MLIPTTKYFIAVRKSSYEEGIATIPWYMFWQFIGSWGKFRTLKSKEERK